MIDYEQLGVFYLGKRYDLDKQVCVDDELVLYDSRDLTTHAVCVGMTGSGKTGLCIDLIEEAAIDGIPVIAVDPKGDLSNLLLTFPEMQASSLLPWVDADEARRKQLSVEQLAGEEAKKWIEGLQSWQQDLSRIQRLKDSAEFTVYTPASSAGVSLSVMKSFNCPDQEILEERDLLREQITSTVTSILALLGISADPLKSKEHILLSAILDNSWKNGKDLDLHNLIELIQTPPVKQLGAMPLESFFPKKERYELAMTLNNLLASPGFEAWMEGEALDIDKLFYSADGKNKVSIISIAHLPDSERMFFVSLLLTQLLAWMRKQSGTSSLRAIFYMDEILGYFPPVSNPPSKAPLITLLKQARAFGLGMVLATQNPVDLDYKGLGNTGTWFIGRLQTERDKMRVLDGLETAASDSGTGFDRSSIDRVLSGLGRQVFLMNNIHQSQPLVFKTRWSLSYLRGPLSRQQLKSLKSTHSAALIPSKQIAGNAQTASASQSANQGANSNVESADVEAKSTEKEKPAAAKNSRPVLPPEISQRFAEPGREIPDGAKLVYKPMIFANVQLRYTDAKSALDWMQSASFLTLIKSEPVPVKWDKAFATKFGAEQLKAEPRNDIEFSALPDEAAQAANYKQWNKDFLSWLISSKPLQISRCPLTGIYSKPQESERDFRIRLQQAAREKRDKLVADLSSKYQDKLASLEDKLSRAEQNLEKEMAQARSLQVESAINVGASIFDALVGRKVLSSTNIRRASSAARKVQRAGRQQEEVSQAQESVETLRQRLSELQSQFQSEMDALKAKLDPASQTLETINVALKKTNIHVSQFCLCWAPCIRQSDGKITAAW